MNYPKITHLIKQISRAEKEIQNNTQILEGELSSFVNFDFYINILFDGNILYNANTQEFILLSSAIDLILKNGELKENDLHNNCY